MADKDPSKDVQAEIEQRSVARKVLDGAAQEFGFAVQSIRQEVVEKGWFGEKVTPALMEEWTRGEDRGEQGQSREPELAGAQDFSREDLYGRDMEGPENDIERDQDRER